MNKIDICNFSNHQDRSKKVAKVRRRATQDAASGVEDENDGKDSDDNVFEKKGQGRQR
jgi:hypothetical protein